MTVVLLSAPYMIPQLERFKPVLEHYGVTLLVPDVHERMSSDELLPYAGQFDGAICGDDRFTENVFRACAPRLKVISKWGTGIDSIDKSAAQRFGVEIRRTTNAFTLPVADSVMGYVLAFARRQPWLDKAMKHGHWEKITGRSLSECTLGVVGVGNCGKAVLRRGRAFGMGLIGNDIVPIALDFTLEYSVRMKSLRELMQEADFVSLNCDLNPSSYHLINRETLSWMKPGAVLINTARGPIVNEPDLIQALEQGIIAGAALDVFEIEPLPKESPLLHMDQVMLAPHNANSSPAAWERVHWNTIRNLLESLDIPHDDYEDIVASFWKGEIDV